MKKVLDSLAKAGRLGLIICAIAYVTIFLICSLGGFADTNFLAVLSILTRAALVAIIVGAIPLLLFLKRDNDAKIVFVIAGGYWLLTRISTNLSAPQWMGGDLSQLPGLYVALCIVEFVLGLALTGVLVLLVLNFILKKEVLRLSALFTFAGALVLLLVASILDIAWCAQTDAGWASYFDIINEIVAAVGVCFGYLHFFGAPAIERKAAPQVEEAKEEPKEEKVEENPAE